MGHLSRFTQLSYKLINFQYLKIHFDFQAKPVTLNKLNADISDQSDSEESVLENENDYVEDVVSTSLLVTNC